MHFLLDPDTVIPDITLVADLRSPLVQCVGGEPSLLGCANPAHKLLSLLLYVLHWF